MFLDGSGPSILANPSGHPSSCCLSSSPPTPSPPEEFLFRLAKISTAYPSILIVSEVSATMRSLNIRDVAGLGVKRDLNSNPSRMLNALNLCAHWQKEG